MGKKRHVHLLMTEIGPLMDLLAVAEYEEDNLWRLMVEEDIIIDAQYDDQQDVIILSSQVAIPNTEDRSSLFALLLEYNAHWERTGGVYLCLEDEIGPVVQVFRCSLSLLDRFKFKTILLNFIDLLKSWRRVIEQYDPPKEEKEPDFSPPRKEYYPTSGFIRG